LPDLAALVARLDGGGRQPVSRLPLRCRWRDQGVLRLCAHGRCICPKYPAETIALSQVVQSILLWSDTAFLGTSPLAVASEGGPALLKPQIADLIRAAYDPVLPVAATDPAHALRLAARMPRPQ
jgi:hypothetical protein